MHASRVGLSLLVAALLLVFANSAQISGAAETESDGLFHEVDGDPPPVFGIDTLASRLVGIDPGQLAQAIASPVGPKDAVTGDFLSPKTLELNLFSGVEFTGKVEHVEPTASGYAMWGGLAGVELGTMTLVVNGSVVVGTVRTPEAVYTIRTVGDGRYAIRQIDESSLPPLAEPLEDSASPRETPPAQSDDVPSDDGSVIDVMVVYTPLAKSNEGGRAAIEALIDLFVAETNQAYANSGVIHRIHLVMREEVQYTEYIEEVGPGLDRDGGRFSVIDLHRLGNESDGYMDHIHELRDLYAADLVHLITGHGDVGGIAYSDAVGDDSQGFAVTLGYTNGLVFAHELGHNMGLRHDRYQFIRNENGGSDLAGWNFGYVNQRAFEPDAPDSAYWRTIMAYPIQCWDEGERWCERLPYFSDPQKTYNGDPMGVPADHPSTGADGPADAVRALNENRHIVANYRQRETSPSPRAHLTLSPYWLSEKGGVSTVTATLHKPSNADTVLTVSASPADAVALSTNRMLTIPAGQTVSVDSVTITGVDNDDRTGDVSVTVSATAGSEGVIDPEPVALAVADDETTPAVTLSLSSPEIVEGEGRISVTATLDNRSSVETTVVVSVSPAEFVNVGDVVLLVIPAGQTTSSVRPVEIRAVDDDVLTGADKRVTVSGAATNPQGVAGPEAVTLTILDDERPIFSEDSVSYTFTEGLAASRFLPEAAHGNGTLTYSISPDPDNDVIFIPGPPARIEVPATLVAADEMSYTVTATDADGVTDTMTVTVTVRSPVCPGSTAASGAATGGLVSDCEALLSARDALAGGASLNWSADVPIAEWDGVAAGGGRVTVIELFESRLNGQIPSELGSLTKLQRLGLGRNQLTGGIPTELGNLSNLHVLILRSNRLTGEIPAELGNLSNLEMLSLWGNRLTGEIPTELEQLSNLRTLWLAVNQLSGKIPAALGDLSNLRSLELSNNRLTGEIPASLGDLVNLRSLKLIRNQLTGPIPASLGGLTNLEKLYLRGNRLTGCIPDALRNVGDDDPDNDPDHDLDRLGLLFCGEHACVTGDAVTDAGNPELVSDCDTLLAARDTLAGTATLNWSVDTPIAEWDGVSLGGTPLRVTGLKLSGHGLSGEIPAELGSLTELGALLLQDNQLSGLIPAELGNLSNLERLYLAGNQLTGCIPDGLRKVRESDLSDLGLSFCGDLACVVDGAVGDSTNVGLALDCEALLTARDALAGAASLNWAGGTPITQWDGVTVDGTPQRVTELTLYEWGLTGEIPAELGKLSNLRWLKLSSNQLTGEIPTELGELTNLRLLNLQSNQLTGEIPTELGKLSNLTVLYLRSNQLTGEIPTELGELTNLIGLDLLSNQLTGEIPTELGELTNLRWLYLSSNQLTGEIPTELGKLSNLTVLYLRSNQLTGEIPTELGELTNLTGLYLSFNQLTGEIPAELGKLSNLTVLALSSNRLTGEIPAELGKFSNLTDLSLWGNRLTGEIPTELELLSNLQTLWLGGNQLTGCIPLGLRDVPTNDLNNLGLSYCSASLPGAPTIGTVTPGTDLLVISWDAPSSNGGSAISAYDLRHIETSADGTVDSSWTVVDDVWSMDGGTLRYVLTGLTGGTQYDLQVRAVNSVGDGPWSATATGTPTTASTCVAGGAVADAANTGLASDCEAMLAARDALAGTGSLNWSEDISIAEWDGVRVEGTPGRVTELRLEHWWLNGSVSPRLGDLSSLRELRLGNNHLSGPIPTELGKLSALTRLDLENNDLSGRIPEELGGMSNLTVLLLGDNNLSGGVPAELGDLGKLTYLRIRNNDLTGQIPPELGRLSNLKYLSLNGNNLNGPIPAELGSLENLEQLYMYSNDLSGVIPAELGDLTGLERLHVANNNLTGEIPSTLGNIANLTHLILSENDLTGSIPPSLGNLSSLLVLYLRNNELSGPIPAELGDLSELTHLYLSNNNLSGCVPEGLTDVESHDLDDLGLDLCASS